MRTRLFLAFCLIALVSVATVVIIARQSAAQEVRTFMFRGGMYGPGGIGTALETFYQAHGSWQGVAEVFEGGPAGSGGQGMMGGLKTGEPQNGNQGSGGHGMGGQGMGGQNMASMMNQRLRLADAQGRVVYDSTTSQPSGTLSASERRASLALQAGDQTVGYLYPEGGMPYATYEERLLVNRLNRAALTAGLVAGGLSLVLALILSYSLLRPVHLLTQAALRLGRGDLSQRVPVRGKDELASLGQTFNSMAGSLQQAEDTRQAMTADIAHELRTPLAVQRAHLEALQDGVYPLTVENLQPIVDQNLLLTRLVEDLRTLALADAGQLHLERVPTDLAGLVAEVVGRFQTQAAQRLIDLRFEVLPHSPGSSPNAASGDAALLGRPTPSIQPLSLDPLRIEQILTNLLSNALRHTPEGGRIQVRLDSGPPARLDVQDSGPGIPPEALPHIFERFYRADRSRSRSGGGSGLGLEIARRLAEVHGATLTAANAPEGGAVFTLTFQS